MWNTLVGALFCVRVELVGNEVEDIFPKVIDMVPAVVLQRVRIRKRSSSSSASNVRRHHGYFEETPKKSVAGGGGCY